MTQNENCQLVLPLIWQIVSVKGGVIGKKFEQGKKKVAAVL